MSEILKITKPKDNSHIFWSHAIKSVLAFSGTFAILFFVPLILGASSSRHSQINEETNWSIRFIGFMMEHPIIQFSLCFAVVVLTNLFLLASNLRMRYIVSIINIGSSIRIGKSNLYLKNLEYTEIPKDNLLIEVKNKSAEGDKWTTIVFFDKYENQTIGIINPDNVVWLDQKPQVKSALKQLSELGIEGRTIRKDYGSVIGNLFSR